MLVFCRMKETGNEVWFVGKYVGYRTEEISVDADYSEYDEERDTFYTPQGWYEQTLTGIDYAYVAIDDIADVIGWEDLR